MQFVGQYQSSLVIPTGATSGARIEINTNNSGGILVYNAAGQLVDSMTSAAGTDANGNQYLIDITTYNPSSFAQLSNGAVVFGAVNSGTPDVSEEGFIVQTNGNGLQLITPVSVSGGQPDAIKAQFSSGAGGQITGSSTGPKLRIGDNLGTSAVDVITSGNYIAGSNNLTPYTWQVPTLAAGFTNNNCQYRLDTEDNIHWQGEFSMTAAQTTAGAATIFTLAAPYIPKKELIVPASIRNSGGLAQNTQCFMAFENTGAVMIGWSAATPAGARFSCSVDVALNNIP